MAYQLPMAIVIDRYALSGKKRLSWAIEPFFKWMEQQLNIQKFYGQREQAVCCDERLLLKCASTAAQKTVHGRTDKLVGT